MLQDFQVIFYFESFVVRKSVLCLLFVPCSPQLLETVVSAEINPALVTIILLYMVIIDSSMVSESLISAPR